MIVRQRDDSFVFITQHDHAYLSGVMAENWSKQRFPGIEKQDDILLAIYQHDIGWEALDAAPFWNDKKRAPYSFIDFPLTPKLIHYMYGIDQVEQQNPYAALLCSIHYCSFAHLSNHEAAHRFIKAEKKRQLAIINAFNLSEQFEEVYEQLRFLKVFDRLSLYLCMNEPGTTKEDEVEPFKDGIKDSEFFSPVEGEQITAYWQDEHQVVLSPFPFSQTVSLAIRHKEIMKAEIEEKGIREAYLQGEWQEHQVQLKSQDYEVEKI